MSLYQTGLELRPSGLTVPPLLLTRAAEVIE
jgi:hypothetical protein